MTYNKTTSSVDAIFGVALGSMKFRIKLLGKGMKEQYPYGYVLAEDGQILGDANSWTYGGSAFAVHTENYGGYVAFSECEFIA